MFEIDLVSDTVTLPTEEMLEAMRSAPLGDDVLGEDPTVNRLERLAAEKLGKEAALLVASGTMGNLVCVLSHTNRGDEVVLEAESHIYYYEVGGMSVLAGVIPRCVKGRNGIIDPDDLESALRPPNIHFPRTRLICIESTHNRGGGTVTPLETLAAIRELATRHGLATHLDGARIFNAAVALGVQARDIARYFDSVMFCLSKGLSAPVGSIVVGSGDFIARARKYRKMLGGGMRQAGVIAAAGIVALEKMVDRLAEDHANARRLAEDLAAIPGIAIDLKTVETNMVYADVSGLGIGADEFARRLEAYGIRVSVVSPVRIRMVTHRHISREMIERTIEVIDVLSSEVRQGAR